jgi:hypothetical protein
MYFEEEYGHEITLLFLILNFIKNCIKVFTTTRVISSYSNRFWCYILRCVTWLVVPIQRLVTLLKAIIGCISHA